MIKRLAKRFFLLVPALLAASVATSAFPVDVESSPVALNILLIVSEDNGPEVGSYGDPWARTPNLLRPGAFGGLGAIG